MENEPAKATKIRLVAKKPHYKAHLRPIWDALPDRCKLTGHWTDPKDLILIAGGPDIRRSPNPDWYPYVYVEHGAGQSYIGMRGDASSGWSGGERHEKCRLFICPNQSVADRWSERYPTTPTAVVGCARLDRWHKGYTPPERTVAITFHWDCDILPETRSAFDHYRKGLPVMVAAYRAQGWTVLGHEHPRWYGRLKRYWSEIGVKWTDEPLRDASVLVADNTSLQAEFLSCGRPVVALNAPWYRRDVHHGERFWTWQVTYADTPEQAAKLSLDTDVTVPTKHPYAFADGKAAHRAASAILALTVA